MAIHEVSPIQGDESARQALSPLFGVAVSFLIINTVFLLLRFFSVLFLRRKRLGLAWDDWFLLPAWCCTTGVIITSLTLYHYEITGHPLYSGHETIQELWRLPGILKSIFALLQLLLPAYAFTRFSVLALYLRVFSGRIVRTGSYLLIAFICCQWVAYGFASAFQCKPVEFYWNKLIPDGKCVNINRLNRSFTPANIAADFIIIVLPLPTIWRLTATRYQKWGYTILLGMGSFALASSVVRAATLEVNDTTVMKPYVTNLVVEWLVIEPSLYFITACLPTMHPLFRLLAPRRKPHHHHRPTTPALTSNSLERLRDDPAPIPRGKAVEVLGGAGGIPHSQISTHAKGGTAKGGFGESAGAVPLRDLRQVETGERVLVQTEIIVSQEERMEEVMGF